MDREPPPSPEEIAVLNELLEWIGPEDRDFIAVHPADVAEAVRAHSTSFQLFRSANPRDERLALLSAGTFDLEVLPNRLTVHRLEPDRTPPETLWTARPLALLRSDTELSIVCDADVALDSEQREGPWRALRVAGTLDFALVGVLASLTATLAAAEVPVFVVSSHDTDYVLVRAGDLGTATAALAAAGHRVSGAGGDR